MRVLLDTHTFLWAMHSPKKLRASARRIIESEADAVFVSAVSAAEIAIKQSLGKLELPEPAEDWVQAACQRAGFQELPLSMKAALSMRSLPWIHKDPFDRLLIGQAVSEKLTVVTQDRVFSSYGIDVVEV